MNIEASGLKVVSTSSPPLTPFITYSATAATAPPPYFISFHLRIEREGGGEIYKYIYINKIMILFFFFFLTIDDLSDPANK
jgi:hypothetical protein